MLYTWTLWPCFLSATVAERPPSPAPITKMFNGVLIASEPTVLWATPFDSPAACAPFTPFGAIVATIVVMRWSNQRRTIRGIEGRLPAL